MTNNVTTLNSAKLSERDKKGRWLTTPGRPVGSKNKISSALATQIRALGPRAVEALATALDKQESWAVQLVIKLVVPGRLIELHGSEPADIRDAFENGELSAEELRTISSGLEKLRSVETMEEFRERLAEIEAMLAQQQPR